jgi:hypothetical protein
MRSGSLPLASSILVRPLLIGSPSCSQPSARSLARTVTELRFPPFEGRVEKKIDHRVFGGVQSEVNPQK